VSKLLAVSCVLLFVAAGCDEDDECARCPDLPDDPEPTLANIWPHEDGTEWVYDLEYGQFEGPDVSEEPPPLPSMEDLHAALQQPVDADQLGLDVGLYRLLFDGQVTTETGVVGQDLVEAFYSEVDPLLRETGDARSCEQRLLRTLARARPDLRPAILKRLGGAADWSKDLADARSPFFLGAYAFAFEDSGYYAYGDLDTEHAWTYLEGDLSVGSEFSLQLVPEIADDIWLHGRVWSVEDRDISGIAWPNALEYLYVVDLGVQTATDEGGEVIGYVHPYVYGTTVFVPEVGPVACHERHVIFADEILQDGGGIEEYRCLIAR